MIQLKLLFILIKHGISPLSKTKNAKYKIHRLTNDELYWIEDKFGTNAFEILTRWKEEFNETSRNSRYRK